MVRWSLGAAALLALTATPARAHFALLEPENWLEQDATGSPQKSAPCGDIDAPNALPGKRSRAVSTFTEGDTVAIRIDERIYHPGHYYVALAPDQASLPQDPPVTPGSTPCGSTVIDDTPELPLLADGLLVHDRPFGDPEQTMEVQLPAGFTCERCVLQVVQFMSEHGLNDPGGCFYHHCADIRVLPAGSGEGGSGGAGTTPPPPEREEEDGGGGCAAAGGASALGLAVLAVLRRRRR